jgi:hypothetical protein
MINYRYFKRLNRTLVSCNPTVSFVIVFTLFFSGLRPANRMFQLEILHDLVRRQSRSGSTAGIAEIADAVRR